MWLLDANMDVHLVDTLEGFGVVAETARARGWAALTNGDLVQRAVEEGFTCLLTHDRAFGQSAAKALRDEARAPAKRFSLNARHDCAGDRPPCTMAAVK